MATVWDSVADYVHSLGLDAYVVGGAVRDELLGRTPPELDFVVPGVGHAELRAALEPHGKVEDLVVADQRVGVRLLPRDKAARALQPAGIEFTPPRVERSTGPGRHDFEIVADSEISLEQDMERRDFTINAIARRLETGEIARPARRPRRSRAAASSARPGLTSFRDDPLRIVRGLRFVSQLDVDPDEDTLRQMREWAPRIEHVSGERIGGGLAADGMGELSKLLLGPHPAKALRLARDTGVLVHVLPEFAPGDRLRAAERPPAPDARRARLRRRPGGRRRGRRRSRCAWRRCCTTSASPRPSATAATTPRSAPPPPPRRSAGSAIRPGCARTSSGSCGSTRSRSRTTRSPSMPAASSPATASASPSTCSRTAPPISPARAVPPTEWERLERFRALVEQERTQPHRLADLAVDGRDLIELGFAEGPQLGQTLRTLLDEVVEEPERNEREQLLARAKELA